MLAVVQYCSSNVKIWQNNTCPDAKSGVKPLRLACGVDGYAAMLSVLQGLGGASL